MATLYYSRCGDFRRGRLNFGDLVGPYLFKAIAGTPCVPSRKAAHEKGPIYFTVGSIMGEVDARCEVWGTGVLSKDATFPKPAAIHAVRGPMTRAICLAQGYACPEIYGDPALLLPLYYSPPLTPSKAEIKTKTKPYKLGILPHFVDYGQVKALLRATPGHKKKQCLLIDVLIDVSADVSKGVERVIDQIVSCETILSSSLHGIIVAHAYGIPAGWIRFSDKLSGDGIKFLDYYGSQGVNLEGLEPMSGSLVGRKAAHDLAERVLAYPSPPLPATSPQLLEVCPFRPSPSFKPK